MSNRDVHDKNMSKFSLGKVFSRFTSDGNASEEAKDTPADNTTDVTIEENPWFAQRRPQPDNIQLNRQEAPQHQSSETQQQMGQPQGRWLYDEGSPYGFSDEDGTLKQVDSANWRKAFGKSSKKGFTPQSSSSSRWQSNAPASAKAQTKTGSTWLLQSLAAVAVIAGGLYVSHAHGPVVKQIDGVYKDAFTQDYSTRAVPAVETFLQNHHVNLPVEWNPSSAIRLHVPLQGKIVHDYSADHPEITIRGTSNEAVLASGSGNVVRITKAGTGSIIMINHGKVGESVYTGVANVGVKVGQYVSAGQVIGHLPASGNPALQFGFEHNGQFVNPHDYIHFSSNNS